MRRYLLLSWEKNIVPVDTEMVPARSFVSIAGTIVRPMISRVAKPCRFSGLDPRVAGILDRYWLRWNAEGKLEPRGRNCMTLFPSTDVFGQTLT